MSLLSKREPHKEDSARQRTYRPALTTVGGASQWNYTGKHLFDVVCGRHSGVFRVIRWVRQIHSSSSTTHTRFGRVYDDPRQQHVATTGAQCAGLYMLTTFLGPGFAGVNLPFSHRLFPSPRSWRLDGATKGRRRCVEPHERRLQGRKPRAWSNSTRKSSNRNGEARSSWGPESQMSADLRSLEFEPIHIRDSIAASEYEIPRDSCRPLAPATGAETVVHVCQPPVIGSVAVPISVPVMLSR